MSSSCEPVNPLGKQWGQNESGRVNQILENARRCAVNAAIAKAQATVCCPAPPRPNTNVQLESGLLDAKVARCNVIQQNTIDEYAPYNNPSRRFVEYQGPIVIPDCPPIPTEDLNANIPKAPTSCTALALLNTGRP